MIKRDSKRRWVARCRLGRMIPWMMILEHRLDRRFVFDLAAYNLDAGVAVAEVRQ